MKNKVTGIVSGAVLLGCVLGANLALSAWGVIPIGFGLMAPAGVLFVGVAFTARDAVREVAGRRGVVLAIASGAVLSFVLEGTRQFAVASSVAFALSESADALVYEPLRKRGWLAAVAASNIAGLVVDSVIFLWLAFGSIEFIAGQVVGKAYMTLLAIVVLFVWRQFALPIRCHPPSEASQVGLHGDS